MECSNGHPIYMQAISHPQSKNKTIYEAGGKSVAANQTDKAAV